MSHLDDGQIHMHLDGALDLLGQDRAAELRAHLESCPDCRARLDREAEVRGRAHALLEEAAPGSEDLPSLEELRREASGRAGAEEGRGWKVPRGMALAWAASIVLALGVGLYGPELWERSQAVPSRPPVTRPTSAEGEHDPGAPRPAPGEEAGEDRRSPKEEVTSEETAGVRSAGGDGDPGAEDPAQGAAPEAKTAGAESGAFRPEAPDVEADIRRAVEDAVGDRGSSLGVAQEEARLRTPAAEGAGVPALPGSVVQGGLDDERAVPGLEILTVEELPEGIARIEQALPGGDTLVVWHVPLTPEAYDYLGAGVHPAARTDRAPRPTAESRERVADPVERFGELPDAPEGWSQIGIRRDARGAFVILRAARSVEFLRDLAARVPF